MDVVRTLRKVPGTNTNNTEYQIYDEKKCTWRLQDVLLLLPFPLWLVGAPTKEYAHPYSMMHRRLTTAGIEVAPHYHQLLVFLYNVHSTDHMILVHTAECAAVVLVPGTFVCTCISNR